MHIILNSIVSDLCNLHQDLKTGKKAHIRDIHLLNSIN